MTMLDGGAFKERRDRRLTNEAKSVAGRCLKEILSLIREDLHKELTMNSRKGLPIGRSGLCV